MQTFEELKRFLKDDLNIICPIIDTCLAIFQFSFRNTSS